MKVHTKETQASVTPAMALQFLKEGNDRFVNNYKINRNLLQQVNESRLGQWPFATVLNCMDSRISAELIFDQGLGDVFSIRIAGNIINEDILGSLEFACKVAGSKLILVMGHNDCGAIKGACKQVELGNLTTVLDKISLPIATVKERMKKTIKVDDPDFHTAVARENVLHSIREIMEQSTILRSMQEAGEIDIVGGMYDLNTGIADIFHLVDSDETMQSKGAHIAS